MNMSISRPSVIMIFLISIGITQLSALAESVTVTSGDVLEIRFDVPVALPTDTDVFFTYANGSTVTGYFDTVTDIFVEDTFLGTYTEGWSQINSRWVTDDSLFACSDPQVIEFASFIWWDIYGYEYALTRMVITGDNSITFDTDAVQGSFAKGIDTCSWTNTGQANILSVTVNTIFSEQDSSFGPKTITVDEQSGKRWLDLNLTTNRSYDEIVAEMVPGGEFEGFRYATTEEVLELFSNADFSLNTWAPWNYTPFTLLASQIGISYEIPGFSVMRGFTGDTTGTPPDVLVQLVVAYKEDRPENSTYKMADAYDISPGDSSDSAYEDTGHWLIAVDNSAPIADAGADQVMIVGDIIQLQGSATDPDGDSITSWSWTIESAPAGSSASFDDSSSQTPFFTTNLVGEYILSLVVSDGIANSAPVTITILTVTAQDAAVDELIETTETINELDPDIFSNRNMSNALANKINAAIELIDQGFYEEALIKLQEDILGKTDGCANDGSPDRNDWITDCDVQTEVYPFVLETIELLESLL